MPDIKRVSAVRVVIASVVAAIAIAVVVVGLNLSSIQGSPSVSVMPSATAPSTPAPTAPVDEAPQPEQTSEVASVVLTFAEQSEDGAQLEAAGYVDGVIEDGGTCMLIAKKDSQEVSVSAPAVPDASTTQCGSVAISTDLLSAGTWEVTLEYSSQAHQLLVSEPAIVEVGA